MILRKPYGLLIKYFKLIHLLLTIPMIYYALKLSKIVKFLDNYISDGYSTNLKNLVSTYINFFMYLAIILIIVVVVAITYLMRTKKKSVRFYILIIIYYVANFIILYLVYGLLLSIQTRVIDSSVVMMYRDITKIMYYAEFIIIAYTVVRGIGFDIKNFNFNEDLEDLDLSEEDSEEIEVNIKLDKYELERKIRSQLRDTKYYVLENKLVFTCITIGVVLVSLVTLLLNVKVYNKTYKDGATFPYNQFNVKVVDSSITNLNYRGEVIAKNKAYLVIVGEFNNQSESATAIAKDDFALYTDDSSVIYPKLDKSGNFIDMANPYYGGLLKAKAVSKICLVYELANSQIQDKYEIKILIGTTREKDQLVGRYKTIKIDPSEKTGEVVEDKYKMKDKVLMTDTPLLNSSITTSDMEITKKYEYKYDYCIKEKCTPSIGVVGIDYLKDPDAILMVLKTKLEIDKKSVYASYDNNRNFYTDFGEVSYLDKQGKEKISKITDRTPKNLSGYVVLQVDSEVANSKLVNLVINTRSKKLIIKLK